MSEVVKFPGAPADAEAERLAVQAAEVEARKAETRKASLWVDSAAWVEADIPRRAWVAPGYALRGAVTVLSGAGGVSKSTLAASWCAALALGKPIGGFVPSERGKALLLNTEDDADEQRLRLSAILREAGAVPADIAGRLIRVGPGGVGTLIELHDGNAYPTPAFERIEELIAEHKPDLIVLDPLVELHNAEENDNTALRSVVAMFRSLAKRHKVAVLLIHHSKKGTAQVAGDADTLRGASSIVGAARIVLTVVQMTKDEAEGFGLRANQAKHYFRVDGAKANYSSLQETEWFERVSYPLDNGEEMVAPVPWSPPTAPATDSVMGDILAGIAAGSADGPWSPQLGSSIRSIRNLLRQHGITAPGQQAKMMAELTATRGVTIAPYIDNYRKVMKGLRTAEGFPASARWTEAES
jgi:hypothetical protein